MYFRPLNQNPRSKKIVFPRVGRQPQFPSLDGIFFSLMCLNRCCWGMAFLENDSLDIVCSIIFFKNVFKSDQLFKQCNQAKINFPKKGRKCSISRGLFLGIIGSLIRVNVIGQGATCILCKFIQKACKGLPGGAIDVLAFLICFHSLVTFQSLFTY